MGDRAFAGVLTASFLVVAALGALHHEMWRDELHAWLVARDSASLWNVFQVTRYEAHFVLWRVLLFGITRCTHNLLALQSFNLLLATTTIWIVARFSPFRRWEKCLLSFGYFFLYEYGVIAQDYNLIVLLMVSFCALYRRRGQYTLGLSAVLFLLANAAPYGLLIALVFSALLVFDSTRNGESPNLRMTPRGRVGAVIVLAGLAGATLQLFLMKAGPNTSWKHPLSAAGFLNTIVNVWRAYIPIAAGFPSLVQWEWGTNFIDGIAGGQFVKVGVALLLVVLSAGLLLKRPSALFLYLVGVGTLVSIQFVVNVGAVRHKGFLFLLFIAALWIGSDSAQGQLSSVPLQWLGSICNHWRNPLVGGLLAIQVVAAGYAYAADWCYPFSGSKQTAQFLRDSGLWKLPIVGSPEARAAPISAYLDKPIYYPESSRFGSYADLSRPLEEPPDPPTVQAVGRAFQLAVRKHQDVVLVFGYPVANFPKTGARLESAPTVADATGKPAPAVSATITVVKECRSFIDEPYSVFLVRLD
ncbi:MAG TPA: hypothetical protein VL486_03800 [Verrucomicrobiae bacterium]|nr:hypothetical protein [Verrucomicrobiae bacterium]